MRSVKSIFHSYWLGCFWVPLQSLSFMPPPHFRNRVQTSNLARASLKEPGKEPLILAACACCKAAIWWTILQIPEIWVFPNLKVLLREQRDAIVWRGMSLWKADLNSMAMKWGLKCTPWKVLRGLPLGRSGPWHIPSPLASARVTGSLGPSLDRSLRCVTFNKCFSFFTWRFRVVGAFMPDQSQTLY